MGNFIAISILLILLIVWWVTCVIPANRRVKEIEVELKKLEEMQFAIITSDLDIKLRKETKLVMHKLPLERREGMTDKELKAYLNNLFPLPSIEDAFYYTYEDRGEFIKTEILRRLEEGEKYRKFFESCSCHFAEGGEFFPKVEIYEAIKREVKQLESSS